MVSTVYTHSQAGLGTFGTKIAGRNGRYSILMSVKEKIGRDCEQSRVCESNDIWLRARLALLYSCCLFVFVFSVFHELREWAGEDISHGNYEFPYLQSGTQISHGVSA